MAVEESPDIEGLLILLNTVGGDIEAGLALAELIAGMRKPTVSLVLGGGHSIGVPLAVSAKKSFIAPTATMTIHPVRMNGLVLGVPQAFSYFERMQERITGFVTGNSHMKPERFTQLCMNTDELVMDVGTVLDGENAVQEGLIDSLGSLSDDRPTSADVSATVTTSPQVQSINVQPTDLTASAHTSSQTQMTSQTVNVPEPLYSRPLYSEPSLASTISDEPVTAETTTGGTVPGTSAAVTASTAPTIAEELVMYQYPFDMDAIRKDLIAYGESLEMTHRDTNPDGTLRTPANCQWWTPERLSAANDPHRQAGACGT